MGGLSLFPYLYVERLAVAVRKYRVQIRDLPHSFEGFTILHMSDLHEKEYGERNADLIGLIGRQKFDAVAITGDLVRGGHPSLAPALDVIGGIGNIANRPIFSVSGNHDWRLERGAEFNETLRKAGVVVLRNSSAWLERGGDRLWVLGVDDPVTRRDRLDLALQGVDTRTPRLLLSHSPHPFREAAGRGIDLMLSGHTHGGQFRVPLLGATFIPEMGFFPRYDYGLFRQGGSTLIVSGGLGESGVSIRFNIRPEFALVTLERCPATPLVSQGATG